MIGETISHHRVLVALRSGGMGKAFRDAGIRLGRPRAIECRLPVDSQGTLHSHSAEAL